MATQPKPPIQKSFDDVVIDRPGIRLVMTGRAKFWTDGAVEEIPDTCQCSINGERITYQTFAALRKALPTMNGGCRGEIDAAIERANRAPKTFEPRPLSTENRWAPGSLQSLYELLPTLISATTFTIAQASTPHRDDKDLHLLHQQIVIACTYACGRTFRVENGHGGVFLTVLCTSTVPAFGLSVRPCDFPCFIQALAGFIEEIRSNCGPIRTRICGQIPDRSILMAGHGYDSGAGGSRANPR